MQHERHVGRRRWIVGGAVVVLALAGGTGAWAVTRSDGTSATVRTVAATSGTIRQTVTATGTIEPAREADLDVSAAGTVTSVRVTVGQRVAKGAVLATVSTGSLTADVATAKAALAAADEQLTSAQDDDASDVQVASAKAQVASATSRLAAARLSLAGATLRAPFAGTIATVGLAVGDVVGSSSGSTSGGASTSGQSATGTASTSTSSQIVLISTSTWKVDASVGSADLASVRKGLQAQITPTGSATAVFGTVSSVGIVAASSTTGSATFPVSIAVTGTPTGLYAGGAASVSIVVKQVADVLTVPTAAIATEGGSTVVHQMKDGHQVSTKVVLGTVYGASTQIRSGIAIGAEVVLTTVGPGAGTNGGTRTRGTGTGAGGFGAGGFGGTGGAPPAGGAPGGAN